MPTPFRIKGPVKWFEFHDDCFNFNDERTFNRKLANFVETLDCSVCQNDFKAIIRAVPPNLQSRESCAMWSVGVHNVVNAKLGKPMYTYEQALADHIQRQTADRVRIVYGDDNGFIAGMAVMLLIAIVIAIIARQLMIPKRIPKNKSN